MKIPFNESWSCTYNRKLKNMYRVSAFCEQDSRVYISVSLSSCIKLSFLRLLFSSLTWPKSNDDDNNKLTTIDCLLCTILSTVFNMCFRCVSFLISYLYFTGEEVET